MKKNRESHGHTRGGILSPTYTSWIAMKQRCTNKKHDAYARYKDKEICSRWLNSFKEFLNDMGERPYGTTLDRINNKMGYNPDNCRWATIDEQQNNRNNNLRNKTLEYKGKEYNYIDKIIEVSKEFDVPIRAIRERLKKGLSLEEAILYKTNTQQKAIDGVKEIDFRKVKDKHKEIIALRSEGKSLRRIGKKIGLSHERVNQIIKKYL